MERSDIVRKFLIEGYQLATDALEYFEKNPEKTQTFLDLIKGRSDKPTVTKKLIEEVLGGISPKVKVVRSFRAKRKEISAADVADNFTKRYQKLSELISKKPDLENLISINRIPETTDNKFSIIAMVREINPGDRTIVVEDLTGSTSIYISDEAAGDYSYLVEDEVIGLVCDMEDFGSKRATKIVFPDIPLPTKIATSSSDILCMFLSDIHIDEPGFLSRSFEKLGDYLKKIKSDTIVFILGDVSSNEEKVKKFREMFPKNFSIMVLKGDVDEEKDDYLPDPVELEIGGVKIFLTHGEMFQKYFERFKISPENLMLQIVKKRHLSPSFKSNPTLDEEKLFLDEVPDIFVTGHFHDPRILNYKGVTLISLGSFITQPIFWSINLKTRETIKIDLT